MCFFPNIPIPKSVVVEEMPPAGTVQAQMIAAIKREGYAVVKVWKCLPPRDSWSAIEVLFVGRFKGTKDVPADRADVPYRAFVVDEEDGAASVVEGW